MSPRTHRSLAVAAHSPEPVHGERKRELARELVQEGGGVVQRDFVLDAPLLRELDVRESGDVALRRAHLRQMHIRAPAGGEGEQR